MGKCPDCGQWQTFVEEIETARPARKAGRFLDSSQMKPVSLIDISLDHEDRLLTGIKEFDRVLGGGLVSGTLVLIGGDPGIGKSTLMLQALYGIAEADSKVLYVSGEESIRQMRIRSQRLSTVSSGLMVVSENDMERIL
jgi:DNA repair protein RadA/Sms